MRFNLNNLPTFSFNIETSKNTSKVVFTHSFKFRSFVKISFLCQNTKL
jgi:hypothetical protein